MPVRWQRYVDSLSADSPYLKSAFPLMADGASVRTVAPVGMPLVEAATEGGVMGKEAVGVLEQRARADMNEKGWLAPLTGLSFVLLTIIVFAIGQPPGVDEPTEKIVAFYVEHKSTQMLGSLLEGIAATLIVIFGAVLLRELSAAEGEREILGRLAFAGTIVFAVGLGVDATITFALAETADKIDPSAVQALTALWHNDFLPLALGIQILMLGVGLGIVRYGILPRWLGWAAIILAVVVLTPIGFVALPGSGLVVAIMSVILATRAKARQRPIAPRAPAV